MGEASQITATKLQGIGNKDGKVCPLPMPHRPRPWL